MIISQSTELYISGH